MTYTNRNPTNDLAKLRSIAQHPETMVLTVKKWQTLRAESNGKSPRVDVSHSWRGLGGKLPGRKWREEKGMLFKHDPESEAK